MSDQQALNLASQKAGPVECLGQEFPSDEARREHYLKLLAEKLKDPEFRKIEGFPIGEDEDILALSDPPYYTACPNPWLGDFIRHYGRPYDPSEKYHREPFAADVSEGKGHPIYNAHSYHTKVPHRAIMRYILHYTQPGDIVLDGFCGTGMTGVAAYLCGDRNEVQELGYKVDEKGCVYNELGVLFSQLGIRHAVLNDLSPAASFIASLYNLPCDITDFNLEAQTVLEAVKKECIWMFSSKKSGGDEVAEYYVWSDIFTCNECATEFAFWDVAVDEEDAKVLTEFQCPSCKTDLTKRKIKRVFKTVFDDSLKKTIQIAKRKLVLVSGKGSVGSGERKPTQHDLDLVEKISTSNAESYGWFPTNELFSGDKTSDPFNVGIHYAHQFFTDRNLRVLASFYKNSLKSKYFSRILALMTGGLLGISLMQRFRPKTTFPNMILSGTLYVGSLVREWNAVKWLTGKLKTLSKAFRDSGYASIITIGSATDLKIQNNSLDYLFVDPPFGSNLMYSELNFLWESWLKVFTNTKEEAIENKTQKKSLTEYHDLIKASFTEAFRVLKPGRWMTVEFSNTQASVWNSIQSALQGAGFVVANVSGLDKERLSFNALNNPTSVKQDLVISAYKPDSHISEIFKDNHLSADGVWKFIRSHLEKLPIIKVKSGELELIAERDPRILYDRMVAFYIGNNVPVPFSSAEFQSALSDKYVTREGMLFLPEQVTIWDNKRAKMESVGQMSIFVDDEKSAIDWLRRYLKERPSTYQDFSQEFMQQLNASWKKFETRPELQILLHQNFLQYDGKGEVPSQIHAYLSTQFKELRNLSKEDKALQSKAKDRWYVPDPAKAIDVETIRNKRLLQEFWELCDEIGIKRPVAANQAQQSLPNMAASSPKISGGKKIKEVRTEAVRLGFKECFAARDYSTILAISAKLPENVIEEDEQLQMIHDMAEMRSQG